MSSGSQVLGWFGQMLEALRLRKARLRANGTRPPRTGLRRWCATFGDSPLAASLVTVEAATKSEARALLKRQFGLGRLPAGVVVREVRRV